MFSQFFCILLSIFLNLFSCYDKTKGANQGQGGVFERRSHVSPLALWFSPFKPLSVTHPPLLACSCDKIVRWILRADNLYSVLGAVCVGKCVLVRCSIREEGMRWKGVQGGKPEGEERMRGSALSSPMGVPLDSFHGYKKNEEDKRKRNV